MTAVLTKKKDRWAGFFMSFLIHVVFFFAGGSVFVTAAEYGVDLGAGVEVSLVAAPMALPQEPISEARPEESALFQNQVETISLPEAPKPMPKVSEPPKITGDGTSPVPGKDATTFHSSAGAVSEAKPKYMRNPAPAYPEQSRKNREEGVVLLAVDVDAAGRPKEIHIKNGSGYTLLDESALNTVRRWKFEPAKIGSLKVESKVEIPIRFQLEGA